MPHSAANQLQVRRTRPIMWFNKIKLINNPRLSFIAVRYSSAVVVALESLLFAKLLGPESYGNYAFTVQIVGLLSIIGAGCGAGFLYAYYKNDPDSSSEEVEYTYLIGATTQYITGTVLLFLTGIISESHITLSCLLLFLQIPYLILFPILRVKNKFNFIPIGRASGSVGTIILTTIFLLQTKDKLWSSKLSLQTGLTLMILGNLMGYSIYYWVIFTGKHYQVSRKKILLFLNTGKKVYSDYFAHILSHSYIYTIGSVTFICFTYTDRLFVKHNYSGNALSEYSLSWQIAQSVLLLLNSLNIISGIRIGESISDSSLKITSVVKKQLRMTTLAGLAMFIIAIVGSLVLRASWFKDYTNLVLMTSIISLGYIVYGITGSLNMLIFLEHKMIHFLLASSFALLSSVIGHIVAVRYQIFYIWPIVISSISLVLSQLYLLSVALNISRKIVKSSTR